MTYWIYLEDNKYQCSKCMFIIQHSKSPKRCPNCNEKMMNSFSRLSVPNNVVLKKNERYCDD